MWKENGAANFRFFFQQRLDSKKKMEESQKSKNMRSMCSFQQANNHRKRIRKFYKTDLSSSQCIVNFLPHKWKMQKSEIYTAVFPITLLTAQRLVDNVISAHLVAAGILLTRRVMRWMIWWMLPSQRWWLQSCVFCDACYVCHVFNPIMCKMMQCDCEIL